MKPRQIITASLAALAWAAFAGKAAAATIATASARLAHETLGAAQDEAVWLEGSVNGNFARSSGILIRGATADWVLIAAHAVVFPQGTIDIANMTVGNGSSYLNDRGQTSGVSEMIISPDFNVSSSGVGRDYALLRLTTRLSSASLVFEISSQPQVNEELLFAGFGNPIAADSGALPNTGNVMAFKANYSTSQSSGQTPEYYDSGQNYGGSLSGVATGGDSGGSVKRWNGISGRYEMVGLIKASNSSATFFLSLYEPVLAATIINTVHPMPATPPVLTIEFTSAAMHLAWDATAAGYQLQSSSDLTGWSNLGSLITAPGTYDDPIASRPRQFYRLAQP